MSATVISVGDDPDLLALRHAILKRAGYQVFTASDPKTASQQIATAPCDILLLCYSIRIPDRQNIAKQFRDRCPDGRIIAITDQPQIRPPIDADTFLYGLEGPKMLLHTVHEQVQARSLSRFKSAS